MGVQTSRHFSGKAGGQGKVNGGSLGDMGRMQDRLPAVFLSDAGRVLIHKKIDRIRQ
jgi:hypothetical protein